MSANPPAADDDPEDEITALVRTLHETQQRLQELAGGEVDAVVHPGGQSYLLHDAQEKLRASETAQHDLAATQAAILNALPAHIALIDHEGAILSVNDGWQHYATANGSSDESFGLGRNYLTVCDSALGVCSDEAHRAAAGIRQVLQGRAQEFSLEYPCHSPTEQHWFRLMVTAVHAGKLSGAVVMHVNVTERKRAEEALRESRHVLEQAQSIGHIGSWVSEPGPPARLVWSAETARIFGLAPGGFDGRPESFSALVHPEDRETVALAAQAVLDGGPAYDREHRIVRPDGQVRWVHEHADLERDPAGRPVRLVGVVQDITDRRQAQAELQRREEHFRSLIENASDLITVLDRAGVIRFQSPSSERVLGYRPAELTGRIALEFIHPDDAARVTAALQRAHNPGGDEVAVDFRFRHQAGGWRLIQSVGRLISGETAEPLVVVNSRDITDRKHLEEQLRQAQKMEAIGQLAGGIAHDFNNILGSILGNTELIRLLPPGSPAAGECLDDILAGSRRAADLVGQILAFSRRQESTRQPLELPPLVREVLKLLRATVPAHVEFRAQLASVPPVLADPSEIHQVAMNLCTNAWHALQGRAGIITVGLAEVEPDEDFIRRHPVLRPGRYVCLTVADDGCGMDEATLGRIFEPFFTTKPVGTGTGLGLSVVHGIVKHHDGGIVVESRPGEGTTFQLYFPVLATEAAAEAAAAPAPQPVPRGAGEHILFVDDEEPLARMGQAMLERLGYRVTRFTSPDGALAAFRAEPDGFGLIVVDHNMPELNGTEFGAQVLATRPGQRIILTTGYSATLTPEAARDLGFRELMPKPYDLRRLGETVHRVLHETGARP